MKQFYPQGQQETQSSVLERKSFSSARNTSLGHGAMEETPLRLKRGQWRAVGLFLLPPTSPKDPIFPILFNLPVSSVQLSVRPIAP